MPLPSDPPATTSPPAFKTWMQNTKDTLVSHAADIAGAVQKSLYNANTLLTADTDDTPAPLTVAASRVVGRKATGGIDDLTTAELAALFGTPDGSKFLADDGTLKTPAGGGGTGLIGSTYYAAGSDGATFTTTSTTLVDADATNLAVTFTVPASGAVRVILGGVCREAGGNNVFWGLREASSIVSGTEMTVHSGAVFSRPYYVTKITGLTPAATVTYKFAHRCDAGTAAIWSGPTRGKVSIEVFSA